MTWLLRSALIEELVAMMKSEHVLLGDADFYAPKDHACESDRAWCEKVIALVQRAEAALIQRAESPVT